MVGGASSTYEVAGTTLDAEIMTIAADMLFTPFDEYLALEASSDDVKHDWIDGLVVAMSRGTPEHGRLSAAIVRALPQTEECRVYSSDTLLYVEAAQHSTYADASIVCGAILTRGAKDKNGKSLGEAITNPSVVVEVLSRSTERRDKNDRFLLFRQMDSLEEYVLISQDERRIEARRRAGRKWTSEVKQAGETIRIHGRDLAVDAIYA
jgi:Uma2 family endonuclease